MHVRILPLAVLAFATALGWQLASGQEPPPERAPRRVDTSAYAIAWTRGESCDDGVVSREDTGDAARCGVPTATLTPR